MPISDQFIRVPLSDITILRDERQRREIDVVDILESVKTHGVLQAIIVERMADGRHVLIMGERRLEASRQAGFVDIPARIAHDLSPLERQLLELLENVKRQDLKWTELVETTLRIHEINQELVSTWTAKETAEQCFMSPGTTSIYLTVARTLRAGDKRVVECKTVREAYNILRRRQQRAAGDALQELLETADEALPGTLPTDEDSLLGLLEPLGDLEPGFLAETIRVAGSIPTMIRGTGDPGPCLTIKPSTSSPPALPFPSSSDTILNIDFATWAETYSGSAFNIVHCDFPYGVNFHGGTGDESGGGRFKDENLYADGEDIYFSLIRTLCGNLDKVMTLSGHLIFWYSERHYLRTREMFAELAPSLQFMPYSLVWTKSDNAGVSGDINRQPRHVYETAFIASRGRRNLVRSSGDAYAAPTDRKLHPSCKPEPVLRHFLGIIADETSTLFDPTCGSGSALRVAEELGAKRVLGLEIDPATAEVARTALTNSRLLRNASKVL